jgi:predicted nucleic acid-binding protein
MEGREEECEVVIDTNIFGICSYQGPFRQCGTDKKGYLKVYFPEYGLIELNRYQAYIKAKREKSSQHQSIEYAQDFLLKSIQIVPLNLYRQRLNEALEIMKDIDEKDAPILALAMQLNCPVWSNDKHFQKQRQQEFTLPRIF